MDNQEVFLTALTTFIFGIALGILITPSVPIGFSCTESAVIKGSATCVKYERGK